MKRRDSEQQFHPLAERFKRLCKFYDLQGLLMQDSSTFTAALEAFEYSPEEAEHLSSVKEGTFSDEEYIAKIQFAKRLEVPFFLLTHRTDKDNVIRDTLDVDAVEFDVTSIERTSMTPSEFLDWWRSYKGTIQTKRYGNELQYAIRDSYYDKLLEADKLKWGGNIDGFRMPDLRKGKPSLIIENRFTKEITIKKYDPAEFYLPKHNRAGDKQTWNPIFQACRRLNAALILCTYSKRDGEEQFLGMAEIDPTESRFLKYVDNIPPCKNLFTDLDKAKEWLLKKENRNEEI